jgi:hypothetical protein
MFFNIIPTSESATAPVACLSDKWPLTVSRADKWPGAVRADKWLGAVRSDKWPLVA